jgi:hypothetical protein
MQQDSVESSKRDAAGDKQRKTGHAGALMGAAVITGNEDVACRPGKSSRRCRATLRNKQRVLCYHGKTEDHPCRYTAQGIVHKKKTLHSSQVIILEKKYYTPVK